LAVSFLASARAEPVLVVPPSDTTLHISLPLPKGAAAGESTHWCLVGVDAPDVSIPVNVTCGIAQDGDVCAATRRLAAAIPPGKQAGGSRRFELRLMERGSANAGEPFFIAEVDERTIKLAEGDNPVLAYNHGTIIGQGVPETDRRHRRACYIHPLWGLNGEVLTDDFPRDHYHHHGVFWTWPHVKIDDTEYDIWADRGDLRQRFVRWLCRDTGTASATIGVENGWFLEDKKMMVERIWMRVYRATDGSRAIDLRLNWIPVDRPITLWGAGGKSYGGLTVRFKPESRDTTVITVPTGRTDADLPDTPLVWADYTTRFAGQTEPSGAAILVHPAHPDFPPTWLTRHYGAMCVGWPGVEPQTFDPGQVICLKYRLWIHRETADTDTIARAYDAYEAALDVSWE
jgi:hypothetical protein